MNSRPIPGAVRAAAVSMGAMAVIGAALIIVGVLEIAWWLSSDAAALDAIFDRVKQEYGLEPPHLLRSVLGAQILMVFGVMGLGLAALATRVRDGRQWARTVAVIVMLVLTILSGLEIGTDAIIMSSPTTYMAELARFDPQGAVVATADIRNLLYPAWYPWLEDVAQGGLVVACVFALLALGKSAVWDEAYFTTRSDANPQDTWGATLAKIRAENRSGNG